MRYHLSSFHLLIMFGILTGVAGCATSNPTPIAPADVGEPQTWGAAQKVTKLKHLYFSGQPDQQTFITAKANGVDVVINVRESGETDWNEAGAANVANLKYYNVPISRSGNSLDPGSISQISTIVQDHHNQEILLHCSSGNRASAWLAVYLTEDHGLPIDAALAVAKKTGLTNSDVEARVVQFLNEPSPSGQ